MTTTYAGDWQPGATRWAEQEETLHFLGRWVETADYRLVPHRLQGPSGELQKYPRGRRGPFTSVTSSFVRRTRGWSWVVRHATERYVVAVYEVDDWSESGEDGALWQLRELASHYLRFSRAGRGTLEG